MRFELTILGCNSAIPTSNRNPTAQVLNVSERFFLIDCGEGTQLQLRKYKFKFQRIDHIFISHLHGDHYFGLIGLLSTLHLLGRKTPLTVFAHPNLKKIIKLQLACSDTILNYELIFIDLTYVKSKIIYEDKVVTVETIILNHRIPCCGFLFREKERDKIVKKEKIEQYNIPFEFLPNIKKGEDFKFEGKSISNKELTNEPLKSRSYAFCSDTCYEEKIIDQIKEVDLLYHEATFMQNMELRAKQTYHSTTIQAATIAKKAKVKKLLIGHFSSRYKDEFPLLEETKTVFSQSLAAIEGETYKV